MPRKSLTINLHPTLPFRSSRLAIPPSPFTPRAPLSPVLTLPQSTISTSSLSTSKPSTINLPPPPSANPLHWIWQCHICARLYRLSVTRRCLDDGHFFCAGTTVVRRGRGATGMRKVRRHRACGSEFDYKGWKEWGSWRRQVVRLVMLAEAEAKASQDEDVKMGEAHEEHVLTESVVSPLFGSMSGAGVARGGTRWFKSKVPTTTPVTPLRPARPDEGEKGKKNCWLECDYPSECRWGKAYGVASPVTPAFSFTAGSSDVSVASSATADAKEEDPGASTGFVFDVTADPTFVADDVASGTAMEVEVDERKEERTAPPTDFRDILTPEQQNVADTIDGVDVSPPSSPTSPFSAASSASGTSSTTGQPAFTDLASLVKSAQRRKSRTESQGSSPLSAQLNNSTAKEVKTMELPILTRTCSSSSSSSSSTSTSSSFSNVKSTADQISLSKAFTDLEFDIRKSVERAGGLIAGVVGVVRGTTPATDSALASAVTTGSGNNRSQIKEKKEGKVRHLRLGSKGSR